jgi:hypothetical protein
VRLDVWMKENRYTDLAFINEVNKILKDQDANVYTWRAVSAWRKGVCVPRPMVLAAIHAVTSGQVTRQDFVDVVNEKGIRSRPWSPKDVA